MQLPAQPCMVTYVNESNELLRLLVDFCVGHYRVDSIQLRSFSFKQIWVEN